MKKRKKENQERKRKMIAEEYSLGSLVDKTKLLLHVNRYSLTINNQIRRTLLCYNERMQTESRNHRGPNLTLRRSGCGPRPAN